jgi:hypothetical protein
LSVPTPKESQPRAASHGLLGRAARFRQEAAILTLRADGTAETVMIAAYRDLATRWLAFAAHLEMEAIAKAQGDDKELSDEPCESGTLQCAVPARDNAPEPYSMKFL